MSSTLSREAAQRLAEDWAAAFNARDLDAVMSHYAEDVEAESPLLARLTSDLSGMVRGKQALRECFARGLATVDVVGFEVLDVLRGVEGMTIYYRSPRGTVAEIWRFNEAGLVSRYSSHYSSF